MSISGWLDGLMSAGSVVTVLSIVFFLAVLGVGGYFTFIWYFNKNVYRYPFAIINKLGNITQVKARVVMTSRGIKKFQLKGYESPELWLSLDSEASININGIPTRIVSPDGRGCLVYCKDVAIMEKDLSKEDKKIVSENKKALLKLEKSPIIVQYLKLRDKFFSKARSVSEVDIDKTLYLSTSLDEVEKSEQADAVIEAKTKYNPMDASFKLMIAGMVIFLVMFSLMTYFIGKSSIDVASQQTAQVNTQLKISELNNKFMNELKLNNGIMIQILNHIGGNYTLEIVAE